ncbi:MAG: HDIG domain-containing metalloprotein [Candidatus Omnitrophota bacterium]
MKKRIERNKKKIAEYIAKNKEGIVKISSFTLGALILFFINYSLEINLSLSLILISLFAYLKCRKAFLINYKFIYFLFLFVINFSLAYFFINQRIAVFYIPFSLVAMLSAILFNEIEITLILSLASSIMIAALAGNNLYVGILFLITSIISSLLVFGARKRMVVIRAGFIISIVQVLSLILINHFSVDSFNDYIILGLNGIACGVIVIGILPLFEYIFKTVTNISLLELADFNHPLLQRMTLEAPGTYHHSLIVGNLSDAAARAVGANALLARIGAYYHDIGKLEKAEYFSENQDVAASKHDVLSPAMSKLVIMNHVKEGAELALKYRLNPRIIDFIQQHHGNSLVYFFYRRALESSAQDQDVEEEGFRYPGPKPNSKETAIVLLADSVEAATRALREATAAKVEEVVHKIINNRFIDGQLDECELTLKDIEKISSVFIRMLTAIYHSRMEYPQVKNGESNHKKSANQACRQPDKDKKNGS